MQQKWKKSSVLIGEKGITVERNGDQSATIHSCVCVVNEAAEWNRGIEYFNTLRLLRMPVVMLQYKGEGHGLRKLPNQLDYTVRMSEFFDHYLKGKPAPKWLKEGIPHLKMNEHIKEQSKKAKKQKSPREK